MATERASFIKAVLATKSRGITLIYILTGFRVIAKLITHRTCTLCPKWSLDTTVGATSIVVRTTLLICVESRGSMLNSEKGNTIKLANYVIYMHATL